MGFTIEDDLNTEKSRKAWLEWKRQDRSAALSAAARASTEAFHRVGMQMIAEGWIEAEHYYGTINCDGINAKGEICGVTTTSGLSWKIPGRAGDSPILGARTLRGRRRRRRRIDRPRRSEPLQPVLVPDRRGDAPRRAPEGRRHDRAQARGEEHDREAAAGREGAAEFRVELLRPEREEAKYAGVSMYESSESRRPHQPFDVRLCTEDGPQTLNCEPLYGGVLSTADLTDAISSSRFSAAAGPAAAARRRACRARRQRRFQFSRRLDQSLW